MADRTWVGSANNNARNPNSWSPTGVPQPGDTLTMPSGTMNIRDNNLAGDTLVIGQQFASATATLNLSHHASLSLDAPVSSSDQVTVNVEGSGTLNAHNEFPSGLGLTVNLADHARLTGAFNLAFGGLDIEGGPGSRLVNNGSSFFEGSSAKLDTRVKGHGNFAVGTAQSVGGRLEFGDSVSCGQSVSVSGDPFRDAVSHVQIDQPGAFKGAVALGVFGEVDLQGLANADSYTFQNDMLSIYSGNTVLDTLRLTTPPLPNGLPSGPNFDLAVFQTSAGVAIDRGGVPFQGTMLPAHV